MIVTNARFPDALHAEAKTYAAGLGISLNGLLAVALREYLDRRGAGPASRGAFEAGAVVEVQRAPAASVPSGFEFFPGHPKRPCKCGSGLEYRHCHGRR